MSTQKTMDDLRSALFETIADLRAGNIEAGVAKTVAELGQSIINTAKAEADFARATGQAVVSGLIRQNSPAALPAPTPTKDGITPTAHGTKEVRGNVTRHRLGG